jgi:hypothetical protein
MKVALWFAVLLKPVSIDEPRRVLVGVRADRGTSTGSLGREPRRVGVSVGTWYFGGSYEEPP